MTTKEPPQIVLFTDFGVHGPYMGQMRAVLHRAAPGSAVIDLFADAPSYAIRAASFLLAAFVPEFAPGTVFLCVIDPGVGGDRPPMILRADGHLFVGPGNGPPVITNESLGTPPPPVDWPLGTQSLVVQ